MFDVCLPLNHVYFGIIKGIWKPSFIYKIKINTLFLLDQSIHDRNRSE